LSADLSDRKPTWSIRLAKTWFVLGILVELYLLLTRGPSWSRAYLAVPVLGMIGLVFRFPWGRFFVVGFMSLQLVSTAPILVEAFKFMSLILYRELVLNPELGRGPMDPLRVLLGVFGFLLIISFITFYCWILLDFFRNERTRKYFVSSSELAGKTA